MLEDILGKGYFPRELPDAFSSVSFGEVINRNISNLPNRFHNGGHISKSSIHNSARPGTLRRKLSVPNPVNTFRLATIIEQNWNDIEAHVNNSKISLTTPCSEGSQRAFDRKHALNRLPELTAEIRSKSKYILKADINRFYPSIYTHSIPWAFHSKPVAKADSSDNLFGNSLDKEVRNAQDRQTIGIPIGPDTSLVIAESILTCIDIELDHNFKLNGLRYIDDYQLGFTTVGEAEDAIAFLQERLADYELALNPLKTEIIELPKEFESVVISDLRVSTIRTSKGGQRSDLLNYFNKAFAGASHSQQEPILKFAVQKLISTDVHSENYSLFENFLLQAASAEPSCLKFVNNQLLKYFRCGYELDKDKIGEVLNNIIIRESTQGHGNEVTNALWGLMFLSLKISSDAASKAITLKDPFVAILLTDSKQKGLITDEPDWSIYEQYMTNDELIGEMWIFVYEALKRGWFGTIDAQNPITQHECFNFMSINGISFYDESLVDTAHVKQPEGWNLYTGSISG